MNAVLKIAKYANEHDRPFCINISALFLTQFFKKEFHKILPYVDILFGNDEVTLASICKYVLFKIITLNSRKRLRLPNIFWTFRWLQIIYSFYD